MSMDLPSTATQWGVHCGPTFTISERQVAPAFHYQDQLQGDAQILHKHPDPKDVKAGGDLRETQTGEASSPMLHVSNGVKIKF